MQISAFISHCFLLLTIKYIISSIGYYKNGLGDPDGIPFATTLSNLKNNHKLFLPGEVMSRTIIGPIVVFLLLSSAIALMSGTDLFNPVMGFIHSSSISTAGAGACLLFTIFGFAAYYFLLKMLYAHFIPRLKTDENFRNLPDQAHHVPKNIKNIFKKGGMNATN